MGLEAVGGELAQAARRLGRAPSLSVVIVATLGLALAACVAAFTVLNAVLLARTTSDPLAGQAMLRAAVGEVDPDLPLYHVTAMERLVGRDTSARRTARAALGGFALAALALTALGLYALLAQTVRERGPEIGVRMAVGAGRSDVLRLLLAEGARLAAGGVLAGVPLAVAFSRSLQAFVFGVSRTDPVTFATVAALLGGVALAACALPAWRATRVDPLRALRSE